MLQEFIQRSRYIRFLPFLFCTFILIISFGVYRYSFNTIENDHEQVFQEHANDIKARIELRLIRYDLLLRGLRGLFTSSISVERDEFKKYVEAMNISKYFPGTLGVGYANVVAKDDKQAFIENVRKEGFADFVVSSIMQQDILTPVYYIEPFEGANLRAFGYDLYSESNRREAIDRAWQGNDTTMAGPVVLVQEQALNNHQVGILLFLPVYKNGVIAQTIDDRLKARKGLVYVPLRIDDMLTGLLGDQLKRLRLRVYDVSNTQGKQVLFDGTKYLDNKQEKFEYHVEYEINLFGKRWSVEIEMPENNKNVYLPILILIGGIVIAVLMFIMTANIIATQQKAQQIARKMNEELEKSHGQLKAINDAAAIGIYVTDNEGKCTYVNEQYKQIVGVSFEQLQGIGWSKYLHPDDKERVFNLWHNAVLSGHEFNGTYRFIQPTGRTIWVKGKANELLIGGKKEGYIGTIEDVTDVYLKENALKESEARLRNIIDNALDPIIVCDMNWKIINWNNQAELIFGHKAKDLIGHNFVELIVDQRDKYLLNQTVKLIASDDSGERHQKKVEVRSVTKDGKLLDVEVSINAIISDQNYLISMFIRNITEEKERIAVEQQRIKTIERMNRLMVDREIKMIELKKKIKSLGVADDTA